MDWDIFIVKIVIVIRLGGVDFYWVWLSDYKQHVALHSSGFLYLVRYVSVRII